MIACSSVSVRRSTRGDSASWWRRSVAFRRSRDRARPRRGARPAVRRRRRAWPGRSSEMLRGSSRWIHGQPRFLVARQCAQRLALACEVRAHRGLGAVGVARLQRGEHGQVLRQALVQPAGRVQLLQPRQLDDLAQIADHLGQPAVVGQRDDGLVDREVGRVVLVDAPGPGVAIAACRAAPRAPAGRRRWRCAPPRRRSALPAARSPGRSRPGPARSPR